MALLVNRGEEPVTFVMPDLIGMEGGRVETVLRGTGFRVTIVGTQSYPGIPAGTVVRQQPAAGHEVGPADAIALAECAARVQPGATAYFNHGYALQMAGRHADAVAPYRAALALDADRPSLRNNLAIALRMSGSSRAEEIALLEAAVRFDPRDVQAWINLVVARLATHDLDAALANPLELAGTAGTQIRTLVAQIDAIAAAHPEAAAYQPGLVL